ncbi:MAG: hypothetical protein HQL82_00600 [Magnetococcales bacterium]|nr:hypothetical protein [Magnetococcales bacterium]
MSILTQCKGEAGQAMLAMGNLFPGRRSYWLRSLRDTMVSLALSLILVWGLAYYFMPDAVHSLTGSSEFLSSLLGAPQTRVSFFN